MATLPYIPIVVSMEEARFTPDYDEVGLDAAEGPHPPNPPPIPKPKPKAGSGRFCTLCDRHVGPQLKRHALDCHLPWFMAPDRVCWTCRQTERSLAFVRVNHGKAIHDTPADVLWNDARSVRWARLVEAMLYQLAQWLGTTNAEGLRQLVIDRGLFPPNDSSLNLSPTDAIMAEIFDVFADPSAGAEYAISPPSKISAVLHWKTLFRIVQELEPAHREELHVFNPPDPTISAAIIPPVIIADAHAHLERCYAPGPGPARLGSIRPANPGISVHTVVTSVNFRSSWPEASSFLLDPEVHFTVGLHPHEAGKKTADTLGRALHPLVEHPRCCGIGEVGLDYLTSSDAEQSRQKTYLAKAAYLAHTAGRPLILHLRDREGRQQVYDDALGCLDCLPPKFPVYIHCFSGDLGTFRRWNSRFDVYIGIGPRQTKRVAGEPWAQNATLLQEVPLSRLLLESDAPYLAPTPWHLRSVVATLAATLNLPAWKVAEVTRRNTRRFYQMDV